MSFASASEEIAHQPRASADEGSVTEEDILFHQVSEANLEAFDNLRTNFV